MRSPIHQRVLFAGRLLFLLFQLFLWQLKSCSQQLQRFRLSVKKIFSGFFFQNDLPHYIWNDLTCFEIFHFVKFKNHLKSLKQSKISYQDKILKVPTARYLPDCPLSDIFLIKASPWYKQFLWFCFETQNQIQNKKNLYYIQCSYLLCWISRKNGAPFSP